MSGAHPTPIALTAPPGLDPAPLGQRVTARLIDYGICAVFTVLYYASIFTIGMAGLFLLLATWWSVFIVTELAASATPGQLMLGLRNVDAATGQTSGIKTLAKYVLYGLFSAVSCGLLILISVLTLDGPLRRSWFDKMAGVAVVRRGPAKLGPVDRPAEAVFASHPAAVAAPRQGATAPSSLSLPPPVFTATAAPAWSSPEPPDLDADVPDLTQIRRQAPAPARPTTSAPRWRLQLNDGEELSLEREVVLGRNPSPPAGHERAILRMVPETDLSISKTHLLVGANAHGVWVQDLHSTNGVGVSEPGRPSQQLVPGERTQVRPGSTITYGAQRARVIS